MRVITRVTLELRALMSAEFDVTSEELLDGFRSA